LNNIQTIEGLSFNAWPSLQTLLFDGWVIRLANGYTKRANSVNPIYDSTIDTEKKIDYCEQLFRSRNIPVVFKMTGAVFPANLDLILEKRGYKIESRTSLQTMEIVDWPVVSEIDLCEAFSEDWLAGFCAANNIQESNNSTIRQMLENIIPKKCFATFRREGQGIAYGLGVTQNEYIGFYDIVTVVKYRNQGIGKQLMSGLLAWGFRNQARKAYLQVMLDNAPAWHLYAQLGFQETYQYWYRIKK
jgi:RimJ/RimL family protein N-acetyltransferase